MDRLAVVGLDRRHAQLLDTIGERRGFEAVPLLAFRKVRFATRYELEDLLAGARRQLDEHPVDGITTFWDFPSSCIAPILAEERGLPTPGLHASVNCEHKLWSRQTQHEVAPKDTPPFERVDVFDPATLDEPPLPYPFWLKPVKSYSGHLGFRVRDEDDLAFAIERLRRGIRRLGDPFQQVLDRLDVPADIAEAGGAAAIAEGIIDGDQCTLEGSMHAGEVHIHGIFDIHRAEDGSTFTHYTYPSQLDEDDRAKMRTIAANLMTAMGYDDAPFNIEFFRDREADRTWILEINPRISQEHTHLMYWVDGATNLEVMAETALGRRPELQPEEGPHRVAGKFFLRRAEDATVVRVPSSDEIDRLEERYAPCVVELAVEEGDRLSELPDQEPYSYLLGYVHLAAADEDELHRRHAEVTRELDLRFDG
jgi:biotin carboxylase